MKADMNAPDARLSALLDGELDGDETRRIVRALAQQPELRETWDAYALIGDHLRGEATGRPDQLVSRVMDRVRAEPVVLVPRTSWLPARHHPVLALAASVAGVAVVGWLALSGSPNATLADSRHVALITPAPATVATVAMRPAAEQGASPRGTEVAPLSGEMGEYLMAHSTQAAPFRLSDGTPQVRTVNLIGRAPHP